MKNVSLIWDLQQQQNYNNNGKSKLNVKNKCK